MGKGILTMHVSVDGSDGGKGHIDSPLRTIGEALRRIRNAPENPDAAEILLRAGVHFLERPVEINAETLGRADMSLTLSAFPGEQVTLSGAMPIRPEWRPFRDQILVADIGTGFKADGLLVGGSRRILARYPNHQEGVTLNGFAQDALSPERVARWKNPAGGFIRALHFREWGGNSYVITGKGADGTLEYRWVGDNNRGSDMHDIKRMVENIFEELDSPGEWFYDRESGQLYYWPVEGETVEGMECALVTSEELVRVTGDAWNRPIRNIGMRGITFAHTHRTLFTGLYERPLRGDWGMVRAGCVFLENTEHVRISDCHFLDMGGNAVMMSGYNRGNEVLHSDFEHIGATGVLVFGRMSACRDASTYDGDNHHTVIRDFTPGPQNEEYPRDIRIDGNYFHDIGTQEKQTAAVCLSISECITVSRNTVHHTSRAGINIHDGTFGGHVIEGNDLFDCVTETADHGPINCWGRDRFWSVPQHDAMGYFGREKRPFALLDAWRTSHIRGNRVHATYAFGIDIDDGASNYEIRNNLCIGVGIKLRDGFDRRVHNNVLIGSNFEIHCSFACNHDLLCSNIVLKRNICNPLLINEGATTFFGGNVYWNNGAEVTSLPDNDHGSIIADPLFVDVAAGDYRVSADSPAHAMGFVDFPMSDADFGRPDRPKPPLFTYMDIAEAEETCRLFDVVLTNISNEGLRSAAGLPDKDGVMVIDRAVLGLFCRIGLPLGAGDVIRRIGDRVVRNTDDFLSAFQAMPIRVPVQIDFYRSQRPETLTFVKPEDLASH